MSRPATAEQPQAPNIDEHVDPSAPPTKELGTIAAAEQDGEQHDFVLGAEWEQSRSSCASSYCLEEFTADMVRPGGQGPERPGCISSPTARAVVLCTGT